MELQRIEIKNFRSIKDMTIEIKEINGKKCIILVGKNEAGKSNILKAIAAVFGKYQVSVKDQRKEVGDENIDDSDCYVRAIFSLRQADIDSIVNKFKEVYDNTEIIIFQNGLNIEDFVKNYFSQIFWQIDIVNNAKAEKHYWIINNEKYLFDGLVYLNRAKMMFEENIIDIEPFTEDELRSILFDECTINLDRINGYDCIFWEYKEQYLLPSFVSVNDFKARPWDVSMPLKNIFNLANITDISKEIDKSLNKDGHLSNLLSRVSSIATSEFRAIWNGFKDIKIILEENGNNIRVFIGNETKYFCEDRSDGFKRFLAILIMLSTPSRLTYINENNMILIDEPDTCLYPTSARFLRDELLNISENSIVIYSTHSPFMIDTQDIDRHLVIEKEKDDISIIKKIEENSPYAEDELLRRAIGTNIFETIKQQNLLFEGYTDYKLFEQFSTKKDFHDYGKIYLTGIKDAKPISQMVILANKQFVIISDSDKISQDKKKDFIENYPEFKDNWVDYADICSKDFKTLEDFYQKDYVDKKLEEQDIAIDKYCKKRNMIDYIETHIKTLQLDEGQSKQLKQKIKYNLAINATKNNIKNEYLEFIKKLKEKIKDLENSNQIYNEISNKEK